MRHAIVLARVTDDEHRRHLTAYAIGSGASYNVIRDWVAQWQLHKEAGHTTAAPLPPVPVDGGRYVVMVPCMCCGEPLPADVLRIVRMCAGCHDNVLQATAEWRTPPTTNTQPAGQGGDGAAAQLTRRGNGHDILVEPPAE
jgi:hypothetical protein